jgi:hypothetical protein
VRGPQPSFGAALARTSPDALEARGGLARLGRVCVVAGLALTGLLAGCERKVDARDCEAIGANITKIWDAEAARMSEGAARNDKASAVIKAEGEKLREGWLSECRGELAGRRADKAELDCLLAAKTLDELTKCSERR